MAVATATALALISMGVGAGTSVAGARSASRSNREAANVSRDANARAAEIEQERLKFDREQFDRQEALAQKAFDAEQEWRERNTKLEDARWQATNARSTRDENFSRQRYNAVAPYRAAGLSAVGDIARLAGYSPGPGDTVEMVPGGEVPPYPTDTTTSPMDATTTSPLATERPTAPLPDPDMPEPDEEGLIPMTMPRAAYERLVSARQPRRRGMPFSVLAQPERLASRRSA